MKRNLTYLVGVGIIAVAVAALFILVPWLSQIFEAKAVSDIAATPSGQMETDEEAPQRDEIRVMVVGDVMLDRKVKALIEEMGPTAPFAGVKDILEKADIALANLESPLAVGGKRLVKDVTFRGSPLAAEGIKWAGIDYVSLANNHALDYGSEALAETLASLDDLKIAHSGAGMNIEEAFRPAELEAAGNRVAVLAFTQIVPNGFMPDEKRAGVAFARPPFDPIIQEIKKARDDFDYVLVSYHFGMEYKDYPLAYQRTLAKLSIDSGADLVFAHHPHVIQGIETYKGKVIAYSLGDFVFDHFSRKTGEAFILDLMIDKAGTKSIEIIPVYLANNGSPAVVQGEEAEVILKRLSAISKGLGTEIIIKDSIGHIDKMEGDGEDI
ncbi:MAG: CapA family protein [Actinomycetota bacterium]|nr:CapA family protein [Actinomycetota bacterium]